MNKLEKLIAKLCPNGVEYKPLGEVCTIKNGKDYKSFGEGPYPVYGSGGVLTYVDHYVYDKPTVLIPRKGSIENLFYVDKPFWNVDTIFYTEIKTEVIIPKFLYYYMQTVDVRRLNNAGGVPSLTQTGLYTLSVAVPPLPVQQEIVRMLDDMAGLIGELEQELAARKQQYEWYRDKLLKLTGGGGYRKITLGDIGRVAMCKRILKHQTSASGEVPFFKIGTFGRHPDAYISKALFDEYRTKYSYPDKGAILLSAAGTIGRTVIFDGEESYYQDSNIVWLEHDESKVLNSYLYFWYQLNPWKVSKGGTIERLYNDNILQTEIVLPPLSEQKKIVAQLDGFDKLCNSMTEGLPGEIAARKQQYEYYRDKLLDFKRAG